MRFTLLLFAIAISAFSGAASAQTETDGFDLACVPLADHGMNKIDAPMKYRVAIRPGNTQITNLRTMEVFEGKLSVNAITWREHQTLYFLNRFTGIVSIGGTPVSVCDKLGGKKI